MDEAVAALARQAVDRYNAEDLAAAADLFRQAIAISSDSVDTTLLHDKLATVMIDQQPEEAERQAVLGLKALDVAPQTPEVIRVRAWLENTRGNVVYHRGAYAEAATIYESAATFFANSGLDDMGGQARATSNAGLAARHAADGERAVVLLRRAADLLSDGSDEPLRLRTLRFLANHLQDKGDLVAAEELYAEIEPATRSDPLLHVETLEGVASLCERRGDPAGALRAYETAIEIAKRIPHHKRPAAVVTLINAGRHMADLGRLEDAGRVLRQARRWAGRPPSLAATMAIDSARAMIAVIQNRDADAIRRLDRSARQSRERGAAIIDCLPLVVEAARLRHARGRHDDARDRLTRALAETPGPADHPSVVAARLRLAQFLLDAKDIDGAEAAFRAAFAHEIGRDSPEATASVMHVGASIAAARDRPAAATLFGKFAVDAVRRAAAGPLKPDDRVAYLRRRDRPFRTLIGTLLSRARLPEAEVIHELIQRERLWTFAARDRTLALSAPPTPWRPDEEAMAGRFAAEVEALREIGRRRALAEAGRPDDGAMSLDEAPHRRRLTAWLNEAFSEGWVRARPAQPPTSGATAIPAEVQPAGVARLSFLDRGNGQMASLVHVAGETWTAPQPQSIERLSQQVLAFRAAIMDRSADALPLAQDLYDRLIAPVADRLRDVSLLRLSLDPPLSHLPFAALHDGKGYLIERFALVVDAGVSIATTPRPSRAAWRIGAFAATVGGDGFVPLDFAADEAEAAAAILGGKPKTDAAFTREALREALRTGVDVLHIASHFDLVPARPERSRLRLGDGTSLTLADLRSVEFPFDKLQLLVLSACATAVVDTGESGLESLAGLALLKGARSVLGTLWPVMDSEAPAVMKAFYRHVIRDADRPGLAEALRRTRASLARPASGAHAGQLTSRSGFGGPAAQQGASRLQDWAGFMLLGDPT